MTMRTMKLAAKHAGLLTLLSGTVMALYAAELADTVRAVDEASQHYGLWPVLAIALVIACGLALWRLDSRNQELVDKVLNIAERNISINREVRDAIRAAPCGVNLPDSDVDIDESDPEMTPNRARQAVDRRAERKAKREG